MASPTPTPPAATPPPTPTADYKVPSPLVGNASEEQPLPSRSATPTVSFAVPQPISTSPASSQPQPAAVRFAASGKDAAKSVNTGTATTSAPKAAARIPSPPPPSTYKSRITFDLFANQSATDPSLTLISQHKHYDRIKGSRTYLCGTDESDYAAFALEYLIDKLVDDGDDIVCVRVVDKDSEIASDFSIKEAEYKLKARQVQARVQDMLDGVNRPAVKVVIELAVGKIGETIDRMVNLHTPISVVVGTRGKSLAGSSFGKGSVSQYLYQHSPVPVIIVRPQEIRLKHLRKRQNDPSRQDYINIAEKGKTASEQGHFNNAPGPVVLEASQHEREAVAKAIGLPQTYAEWNTFRHRSASRSASKDRRASSGGREESSRPETPDSSDADDDDEDGAPLSRASSTKGTLDPDDRAGYVFEGSTFEDMPNFIPGLGNHRSDADDGEDGYENRRAKDSDHRDGSGADDAAPKDKGKVSGS